MSKSRARLDDLQWLADELVTLERIEQDRHWPNSAQRIDRVHRLQDWMGTVIDTRLAQMTQPETKHHKRLMEQYDSAVHLWRLDRERVAADFPGDLALYDAAHPQPSMRSFLVDQAQRVEQAKACDCPLVVEHRPDCPQAA